MNLFFIFPPHKKSYGVCPYFVYFSCVLVWAGREWGCVNTYIHLPCIYLVSECRILKCERPRRVSDRTEHSGFNFESIETSKSFWLIHHFLSLFLYIFFLFFIIFLLPEICIIIHSTTFLQSLGILHYSIYSVHGGNMLDIVYYRSNIVYLGPFFNKYHYTTL